MDELAVASDLTWRLVARWHERTEEETRRLGLPTEGYGAPLTDTLAHPLSRHWLLQDKVHLSAEGHQLTALLVAAALQACSLIVLWEVCENAHA